ncbi:MAG TPA: MFS transporter [Anaerolineales bacterium]|nr:MFS transporter [Anaerolineales bacterium]HMX75145.1 MFS transporter [Anaerolineales bacterium]HMZ43656.1 MFS transporter [Anaerolineales bacterium]HNB87357.1 MFS transporter [Anaerolineales bacterium]HNC89703.1 MFS transporter [Anaerolineales bacterium]
MFINLKLDAKKVYLFIEFTASALFAMMFVTMSLYEATVAGLTPLQLVLVGTALEVSAFVFEIPTGVVADVYSRRLSIIIGYFLMGIGFLVEGLFPAFLPILLAQVIWGLGYTFTSGATQAWISDEIGEEEANKLVLRANRVGLYASLLGMGMAVLIGSQSVGLPILFGGAGVVLIGLVLVVIMPETGFHPTPREDRNNWQHMAHTFKEGIKAVRARPRLMTILGIGLLYGLYSEGFDRLWVKHILDTFELPVLFGQTDVAFFGLLRAGSMVLSIFATRFVEKRIDTGSPLAIGRATLGITFGISAGLIGFALSPIFAVTIIVYWFISVLRNVAGPLYNTWVNQKLDPNTRATVLSMSSQVDAIGQMGGGPLAAAVAGTVSVVAAIITSGLLLLPALPLIGRANSQSIAEKVEQTVS